MPRKSVATKSNVFVDVPAKRRPLVRSTTATSFVTDENLIAENEDDDRDADGSREDFGVLNVLRDYQKRKAKKEATRIAALRLQKNALFAEARKGGNNLVRFGTKHIEDAKAKIAELKSQELTYESQLQDLTPLFEANDKSFQFLLSVYSFGVDDIFPRRSKIINDASATLQVHPDEIQRSCQRILRNAKALLNERLTEEKIATDATTLIKHYQALLLS